MASIFTKIIQGEIPCYKIAEDDNYYAFLDINPVSEGHTLCVPKKEVDYIFDLDEETLSGLMNFSKKVALGIDKALETVRTGVIVEGLEVPHAHVHLVPIYYDGQPMSLSIKTNLTKDQMQEIAEKISQVVEL